MIFLRKFIRELLFYSPWRRNFFPRYSYNFSPSQLCFLCQCLTITKEVPGDVIEVGCDKGRTTLFLNKYMDEHSIVKRYFAIDTFSGFTKNDIQHEISKRDKEKSMYRHFRLNSQKWFDGTMKQNKVTRVKSIKVNVNDVDLGALGPFSFVLLDVDLYLPMQKALPELYEALAVGGIMILDDCDPSISAWDGSYQAFKEFTKEYNLKADIRFSKLGIIEKT